MPLSAQSEHIAGNGSYSMLLNETLRECLRGQAR